MNKVSYKLFLLGCSDLRKVWRCFKTFTTFSQTSIARMFILNPVCSSSTQCICQNINGKTSEVFNSIYSSLRVEESLNSFYMVFNCFSFSCWLSRQSERLCAPHVIHTTQQKFFLSTVKFQIFINFSIGVLSVHGKHDHWFLE